MERENGSGLLREKEAAEWLGVSHRTLQSLRVKGSSLKYISFPNKAIRYHIEDLIEFINKNVYNSTAKY